VILKLHLRNKPDQVVLVESRHITYVLRREPSLVAPAEEADVYFSSGPDDRLAVTETVEEVEAMLMRPLRDLVLDGTREPLADLQHDIWSHWMQWLFACSTQNPDGTVTIHAEKVERWKRQMTTPYAELSEPEKDSDREQADKVIARLKG